MFYFQHCLDLYLEVVHRNVAIIETSNQHVGVLCIKKSGSVLKMVRFKNLRVDVDTHDPAFGPALVPCVNLGDLGF